MARSHPLLRSGPDAIGARSTWINRTSARRLATTSDPGACSARNFVIVEMPDTFVGVRLFIVSNLPLAVQLPYFNLISFDKTHNRIQSMLGRWKDDGSQSCEGGCCGQREQTYGCCDRRGRRARAGHCARSPGTKLPRPRNSAGARGKAG